MSVLSRPTTSEYVPYYGLYIDAVPDGNILDILAGQAADTVRLLSGVSEERAAHRYEPGKWSVKQVMGHVTDVERLFGYRAMCFARNDSTPLPSFEQDDYVTNANFDDRTLRDIVEEFRATRESNVTLFRSLGDELVMRRGTASGFPFTVRAILYILAGHELHHRRVLKERYGVG